MLFAVVEFPGSSPESTTVEIVPLKWLNDEEDKCYWPPISAAKVSAAVKKMKDPSCAWKQLPVSVLGKAG
jgi:hypothetical protein